MRYFAVTLPTSKRSGKFCAVSSSLMALASSPSRASMISLAAKISARLYGCFCNSSIAASSSAWILRCWSRRLRTISFNFRGNWVLVVFQTPNAERDAQGYAAMRFECEVSWTEAVSALCSGAPLACKAGPKVKGARRCRARSSFRVPSHGGGRTLEKGLFSRKQGFLSAETIRFGRKGLSRGVEGVGRVGRGVGTASTSASAKSFEIRYSERRF